jgi:hypothetical protein
MPLKALAQRVGVITPVGNYALRLWTWAAFLARDADLFERSFRQRNFRRSSTFQPNSQRKTFTVDNDQALYCLVSRNSSVAVEPQDWVQDER